ncbi:hypothetical protein BGZ60DRAFT_435101 [Tricladium varicosporioides]|nr:hypothetical protein BGZ60DRAFT_435101 [Hymenoscyphus varicosporioides]
MAEQTPQRTPWKVALVGWGKSISFRKVHEKITAAFQSEPEEILPTSSLAKIDNYPRGYPQFAALINADPAFAVFRRFGTLRARSLLYKQDELVEMEAQLNELDAAERRQVYLSSRRRDSNDERKNLVHLIDKALIEYVASETQYLNYTEDFMNGMEQRESDTLASIVESAMYNLGLKKLFQDKYTQQLTNDKNVIIWSNQRVHAVSRLLVIILNIILLVVPIVLLYLFERTALRFSIIIVFMMLFLCALSLCTRARNLEIFAATAAYAAVLVVFVSNVTNVVSK